MRHIRKITTGLVVAGLALTACGGDDPAETADPSTTTAAEAGGDLETTIKILAPSYSEDSQATWQTIIDKFNEEYPNVEVELQIEGWDDFSSKVQARIQAQDYPDILNDNNFASAAEGGLLYPIDELLSQETLDAIEPALLDNGKSIDGKQWAVPDIASSRLLAYNTDLFEAAGIAEAPTTWDELEEAARAIVETGDGAYGYGLPLGREEAQVESSLWLWGAGGDWLEGDNLVANTDKAVEAFEQMKMMIDEGLTQPDVGATNRQQAADLFNNGQLGMMMSHSGLLGVTRADFPETNFAIAPIPSKEGEPVAFGVTDFIVAFDNGDEQRKAATAAFLDLMYTDEMYEDWYKATGLLPVTTSMIEQGSSEDEANGAFYDALEYVQFLPVGNPQWDALQSALQGSAGRIENSDPATVLDEIQAQVEAQS